MTDTRLATTLWRRSSHSGNGGGQCVEIAAIGRLRLARDSKDPDGPMLGMSAGQWSTFVRRIKGGEYDRP